MPMKFFWMVATMLIVLMFVIPFSACNKGKMINASNLNTPVSSKEVDQVISVWYLDQYEAIDILSRMLETRIEYGSKIENSPADLLKIQKDAILKYDDNSVMRKLMPWAEKQRKILEKLEKELMIKKTMMPVTDGMASREGLACLEAQVQLIDQSLKRDIPLVSE